MVALYGEIEVFSRSCAGFSWFFFDLLHLLKPQCSIVFCGEIDGNRPFLRTFEGLVPASVPVLAVLLVRVVVIEMLLLVREDVRVPETPRAPKQASKSPPKGLNLYL